MPEIFTPEWAETWCQALNEDATYAKVARTWEGSLLLVMEADPDYGISDPRSVWADLWHGKCRKARVGKPEDFEQADFVLQAPASIWYLLLTGQVGPIPAIIRGQLRLAKGNLMALLPYVRAAQRLVAVAVEIGTTFPKVPKTDEKA